LVTLRITLALLAPMAIAPVHAQAPTALDLARCPSLTTPVDALNARTFGALGDGLANDTVAIQAAVNAASAGGTVFIPAGTYLITVGQKREMGINLKDQMTLLMARGATLKALATADGNYAMIRAWGVHDVRIQGGILVGERDRHLATTGEWGMGVDVRDAVGVTIQHTEARGFWGDGFYFGGKANQHITVCGVLADGNRRNGMSIVSASGMTVQHSRFTNTHGTAPEAGLDIEPNAGGLAENVVVANSDFFDNRGDGISIGTGCERCAVTRRHLIVNNSILGNGKDGVLVTYEGHRVEGNLIEGQGGHGIRLWNAEDSVVAGNTLRKNKRSGLQVEVSTRGLVRDNVFDGNEFAIFFRWPSLDNVFTDNRCFGNRFAVEVPKSGNLRVERSPGCLTAGK
jgi:parallel beta-helix repeat protein